jgi:hypothetical protein
LTKIEICQWPVIVVANYRTASSPFINAIREQFKLGELAFIEPTSGLHDPSLFLNQYYSNNKKYAIKIIVNQITDLKEYRELLLSDCFKIKLTRLDIIDQIVSYYIAKKRNVWFQRPAENIKQYEIDIDDVVLTECINTINNNNLLLDSLSINFNSTYTYEELGYIESAVNNVPTTMPLNFNNIKKRVEELYAL